MMTTTPKFQTSSHRTLGFVVIASLWLSLVAGFVAHASRGTPSHGDADVSASATPARPASAS